MQKLGNQPSCFLLSVPPYLGKGLGGSKLAQLSSTLQKLPSKKHILPPHF